MLETFAENFESIKQRYDAQPRRGEALICKAGFYGGCPVLKLQKAAWTNDDMSTVPNQTGVFFSIWLDESSLPKQQVHYNIHALKLRQLKAYRATSIDFAKGFRDRFAKMRCDWPNASTDFGPQTLMQGWIPLDGKSFGKDVLALMNGFAEVSPIIDQLLADRKREE